jgi:hypothetical protein
MEYILEVINMVAKKTKKNPFMAMIAAKKSKVAKKGSGKKSTMKGKC